MKNHQISWSVNCFAQSVAKALPALVDYRKQTDEWLESELPYSFERINQIKFIESIEPKANFMLWNLQKKEINIEYELAKKHNILIRDCSNYRGLYRGWFRTAIRSRKENEQLFDAIENILSP